MVENKKKYAYWMYPSTVAEMEKMLDAANAVSKSDFVCQAVKFYIANREKAEVFRNKYVDGHPVILEGWDRLL